MNLQVSNQQKNLPTFFTGCIIKPLLFNDTLQPCHQNALPELSPEDFVNIRKSLSIINSTESLDLVTSRPSVRRTLLPTPINSQTYYANTNNLQNIKTPMVNEYINDNLHKPQESSYIMDYPKRKIKKGLRLFAEDDDAVAFDFERDLSESTISLNSSNVSLSPPDYNFRLNVENDGRRKYQKRQFNTDESPNTSGELSTPRKRKSFSPHPEERHKIFRPHTSPSVWDQLSSEIWRLYNRHKQTSDVYEKKMMLRQKLHDLLLSTFPRCRLYVVGSSMTGFGTKISDMDMCLMLTDEEVDQQTVARTLLINARKALMKCNFISYVEFIPAKVPILKFRDRVSFIEVDLNLNNTTGIRNTHLLNSYSRIDERVPPLTILVKMWAKQNNINDAKHNTLSSYSLALMVIHYLQYGCSPPVVPCLQQMQPEKYRPNSNVRTLVLGDELPDFKSHNKKSIGHLFLGFLNYFANKFDYSNDVMSVRLGGTISRNVAMNVQSPKNKLAHWKYICIEEPFDLTNTACSVFKDTSFYYIHNTFLRCWNTLNQRTRLQDVLNINL